MQRQEYDIIVIGGGHNGEAIAAYLSKAGLKTILLEKRLEVGGGLAAEEATIVGFLHNIHSIYHMAVEFAPPYRDLNLEELGARYVYPEVQIAFPLRDGQAIVLYADPDRTSTSIRKISEKDGEVYRKVYTKYKQFTEDIIMPATYVPPLPAVDQITLLEKTELGAEFLELSERTPLEVVEELFVDERVRALMLYLICMWGLQYDLTGLGYLIPLYFNRATNYRLCVGTSHKLSSALTRAIYLNGGMILDNAEVIKIIVEDGEAKGVELADGRRIWASKAIISTLNPPQTFLRLIGKENLDEDFVYEVEGWEWEHLSLFTAHLALKEPPKYRASTNSPDVDRALICVMGFEAVDELTKAIDEARQGKLTRIVGNATCPTLFDNTQAPIGMHTALFENPYTPYDLVDIGEEGWDRVRLDYLERCLNLWQEYAPNLSNKNILKAAAYTPLDIERKLSTMVKGSIKHGAYIPTQMGYFRPNMKCSSCRTPIKRLYVGGASTYPGGLITFGPGYNAVNAVAEDLGIEKWWKEPEYITKAREKGYIP
ncbi:MAG: NAD(P)/FAD-dependent oxidoreductase [Nitrososphaerales archaeon]